MENGLVIFEQTEVRSIEYKGELWFSVIDIIEILVQTPSPKTYWDKLKKREFQTPPFWEQLKLRARDGKMRATDCGNTEGILRIIQSVPSPKAEPIKQWLANVGKQAIEEMADPEIGFERLTEMYKLKGHTDEWIKNRLQSIKTRKQLTDEWKNRGVKEGQEYSILTATIAKETFGLVPSEHAQLKGLEQKHNLRDNMTPLELIFTALGEEITRTIAVQSDAQGFNENHEAAQRGGNLAGKARERVEESGEVKVVSAENFLGLGKEKDDAASLQE